MPKPLRLIIATLVSLLLLLVACAGIALALLGSEAGLRLVAGQVQARAGGVMEWSRLEGSLLSPLQVEGLQLSLPGLSLTADEMVLSWQPGALLKGEARVDTLRGAGIRLVLSATDSEPDTGPFNPGDISLPIALVLVDVSFSDLQITQDGQDPVEIDSVALSAQLANGQLAVQRLTVRLPQGGLSLAADASLASSMPLNLELAWDWLLALPDDVSDTASPISRTAPLKGELKLEGNIEWREHIDFALRYKAQATGIQALVSELPVQLAASGVVAGAQGGDELLLREVSLALADTPLSLSLSGKVTDLTAPDPKANIVLDWKNLSWPPHSENPEVASNNGTLDFGGDASDYRVGVSMAVSGRDIPTGDWKLTGSGNSAQLWIESLTGQVLGGELLIDGNLQWDPAPRWDLTLSATRLNPAQLLPELPGLLTLDLLTSGGIDQDTGIQADLVLRDLNGTLLDYSLRGDARVNIAGDKVQIGSLKLQSSGNSLSASGALSPDTLAIDWQLTAGNPGGLLAGAAGELIASGRVTGSPEAPLLQASASGSQMAWETYSLPSLTMSVTAGMAAEDPLKLALDVGQVMDGENELLSSLQLQVTGSTANHRLRATAATPGEQVQLQLDGGLDQSLASWRGQLSQLSLTLADYGKWTLAAPALLSLAENQASLADSCLQNGDGGGRLCVASQWSADGDSELRSSLHALALDTFVPAITGAVDGDLLALLAANGKLQVDSAITLGSGEVELDDNRQLTHGGGKLQLQVNEKGMLAQLLLATPEQGELEATARLPALNALPITGEQPLTGSVRALLPDLSGLAAWVPELASSAGQLSADMQLTGSLSQPWVEGTLAVTEGAATLPLAGLRLEGIEFSATSDGDQPGRLALSGGMRSGPGQLALVGDIDLASGALALTLSGDRFQVYDTADVRALLSPDLQINWLDDTLTLRGQLQIPEAAITPKIQLSPAALGQTDTLEASAVQVITPSRDVVVVSTVLDTTARTQAPEAPFHIDSRIRVLMGDYVQVNAMGFISRITGSVDFTNRPEQDDLIPFANGRFSLKEGTFRAFGQDLEIEAGHLIFANVPATEPELNLRAVRWIDSDPQVTAAGILVTGPVKQPALELFSRPQLDASEIQSYLLTGSSPSSRDNVLGIGTYVSRRIYVGYGYNMLEETSEFNSLFNISPRYGVGTSVGEADNNINMTITYER